MTCRRPIAIALVLACSALSIGTANGGQVRDRYWQLGVGCYFGGIRAYTTELDVARFDWLYLCYGNIGAKPETTQLLNRLLKLNPKLKIVIRVWPIMGLGDCKNNSYQATFLHYLYKPGVKEKLLKNVHDQIHVVLDLIDKPENVIGLTFLEELPGHFSGNPFHHNDDGAKVSWALERFRTEIEAERGKPLVWDDDTRRWWAAKWTQVIGEIHAAMKKESGGRLVFYYQQTNHSTLDFVPEGTPLSTRMLIPIRWADIVKPGLCDGLFAYPNGRRIWQQHYVRFAKANNWPLFSQLSHPSGMRLGAWPDTVAMVKERFPQNLGYFWYCSGNCAARQAWNADKGIPQGPAWNTRSVSIKLHTRRHLAMENVGMDVVRRQPPLRLHIDMPLDKAKPGGYIHPRVIVENAREASFFLDPKEATVRNATITLGVPKGFKLEPQVSPPATLKLGDLAPGERRVADWWVTCPADYTGKPAGPFALAAKADGVTPTTAKVATDLAIPCLQPHEIGIPGTQWMEAAYRIPDETLHPRITIEALRGPVRRPTVGDGYVNLTYGGLLATGMRLVLDAERGARLFVEPLVDDDGTTRADPADPCGFKACPKGYLVHRVGARGDVDASVPLRVSVWGKAEGGGQSLIVLRFARKRKRSEKHERPTIDKSVLVNRFNKSWREVSTTVTPPEDAIALQNVFLYRFKQKGTVWYGPLKITRADATPEGTDVSDRLRGSFPTLSRGQLRIYRYADDNPPDVRPRVRVQLAVPEE